MRRSLSLFLSGLLSVVVATSVHADAKTDFGQGLQMYNNKKNYAEAARLFRKAIAQSGQESRRPADAWIYGDFREEYLPHYWLARALVATGQCTEAHAELTLSENQGALRLVPRYYRTVAKLRADCPVPPPTQVAETSTPPPPVVTSTGNGPDRSVTDTIAAPPPITTTTAATATINPVVVPVTNTAVPEDPQLAPLRARLRQQMAEARRLRGATIEKVTPAWSRAQADLQASLKAAERVENGTDRALLTRITGQLAFRSSQVTALLPPRRPGPPAELRKAVTEFFEGDYANAAETLRNARFSDARAEAQTRLIRGAARYSLYMMEGRKNPALLDQALEDLAAFSNANPSGTIPFASSFSPRLLKVLTDIRKK